ncbi:hypothetical protein, partial [Enterobacter hormaechei]|uniref:hypothetical protein n=1 Tax=Enterobacter hormaechei TaxID=158836 RepID=UPI001CC2E061
KKAILPLIVYIFSILFSENSNHVDERLGYPTINRVIRHDVDGILRLFAGEFTLLLSGSGGVIRSFSLLLARFK